MVYIPFCNYRILLPGVLWGLFPCLLPLAGTSHLFHTTPSPLVSYGHYAPSTAAHAGTHMLWNLAAAELVGSASGFTWDVLLPTLLRKHCNLRKSSVSPIRPLYMVIIVFSPATVTSVLVLSGSCNTSARSWNTWLVHISFRASPFLCPYIWDMVSHPRIACANSTLLHTCGPSMFIRTAMLQYLGAFLVPQRGSGQRYIFVVVGWVWKRSSIRISVSSATKTANFGVPLAAAMAVCTISRSASVLACSAWHPWSFRWSLSRVIHRCLFSLFERKSSFQPSKNIEPETYAIGPTCIPDLQFCVVSFVLGPLGYPCFISISEWIWYNYCGLQLPDMATY